MAGHTLVVTRDADTEYGPDASIECHGVTEACAEWIECGRPKCRARSEERSTLDDFVAHGEQHRYFDQQPSGF